MLRSLCRSIALFAQTRAVEESTRTPARWTGAASSGHLLTGRFVVKAAAMYPSDKFAHLWHVLLRHLSVDAAVPISDTAPTSNIRRIAKTRQHDLGLCRP
jgi:hypothetical protein